MNRVHLMSFAAIAALSMFNGAAKADDGGSAYDNFPVALIADSGNVYDESVTTTCADAKRDAWFLRQMELSDGDVDPSAAPAVTCRTGNELIASAPSQDE